MQVLRADGCPLDAASLAIRGALHATRVPHVVEVDTASADQTVDGKKPTTNVAGQAPLDLDLDETLDDSTPFNAASLPLFVTLCDLGGKLVADCNAKERRHVALRSPSHSILMVAQRLSWAVAAMDCTLPQRGTRLRPRAMCSELHEAAGRAVRDAALSAEQRHGGTAYAEFNAGLQDSHVTHDLGVKAFVPQAVLASAQTASHTRVVPAAHRITVYGVPIAHRVSPSEFFSDTSIAGCKHILRKTTVSASSLGGLVCHINKSPYK